MRGWALVLALLAACGETSGVPVSRAVSPWPFRAGSARLTCEANAVTVEVQGRRYAVNGTARSQARWPYAASVAVDEMALDALVPMGLELCRTGDKSADLTPGAEVVPSPPEPAGIVREESRIGRSVTVRSEDGFEIHFSCADKGGIDFVSFDFKSRPARIPDLRNNLAAITVNGAREVFEMSWLGPNGSWVIRSFPGQPELGRLPSLFLDQPFASVRQVGISMHDAERFGYPPGLLWEISEAEAQENAKFCAGD